MNATEAIQGSPITVLGVIDLPGRPVAAPSARKFARALFAGVADDRLDDLALVVGELVANSVRHSDSGRNPNGEVTVAVASYQGTIYVNVTDDGSATSVPHLRLPSDVERLGGRGLRVVDQIADNWGYRDRDTRRVVWLRLNERDHNPDDPPPWPPPWSQAIREMSEGPSYEIVPGLYFEVPPGLIPDPTPGLIPDLAPGTAEPEPPRPPVHDQITMIAMAVAERIRTGEIVAHQRLTTRQLMAEHGISRGSAWSILRRLVFTWWAYDTERKGVRAAPYRDWPRQGASMALIPAPADRHDGARSRVA
ncbi:ATP-binding protein [Acrocarpospora sp. B8E8]|uniref:ATP-binding protein n=1 Tax=Acrocarpospora sp. B8E8 TaxID=3153572 RepID=UPI00325E2B09